MNQQIEDLMASLDVTRKGAETISNIVRVGVDILLEEGFPALTKRKIAARLNISHGNVSYYFPTREALWHAVIDYELKVYYQRHHDNLKSDPADPQGSLDSYVTGWIDEYSDRVVRIFFSHIIAFAEVNESIASIRDEIYERFYDEIMGRARALDLAIENEELERRVLEVIVLLEGLHVVSAFRPSLLSKNSEFKQRLLRRTNAIIHGE